MAHRTDYNPERLDLFKNRLLNLMISHNVDSAKKLATALYKNKLVEVNSVNSFTNPDKVETNAIGSIEKKIQKHLRLESAKDVQGEFIIAYSIYFDCSTDYITCQSDIKSKNIRIKQVCETTGLSEDAVRKIIRNSPINPYADILNKLFSTTCFRNVVSSIKDLDNFYKSYSNENPYELELSKNFEPSIVDTAFNLLGLPSFELEEINPNEEVCSAMKLISKIEDYNYDIKSKSEFEAKVLKYDLQTDFNLLIEELYPHNM